MFFNVLQTEFHMWIMFAITVGAIYAFVREKWSLELTSVVLLTLLLLYGQIFAFMDADNKNMMDAKHLLAGFANPSLIAVLALLVMGQGMIHTDSLRFITNLFVSRSKNLAWLSVLAILIFVMTVSAFMNNTPLVIIAIPIMQSLMQAMKMPSSKMMMSLSYIAIIGGMTTVVGSSTNLLVSSTMVELGYEPLGFFSFTIPALFLVGVGFLYILLVVPRISPTNVSLKDEIVGNEKRVCSRIGYYRR